MSKIDQLYILICIQAYLLGSIPFGLILTKSAGLGDIRRIGSGNIGATNVLRTGNKKIAALTLLLDGLKGTVAVLIARHILYPHSFMIEDHEAMFRVMSPLYATAFAAVLGHMFPIWLKFRGGKGVITTFGVTVALAWPVGVAGILAWLFIFKIFRVSSIAGLSSIATLPVFALLLAATDPKGLASILLIIAVLVLWKHRNNLRRLRDGTELKIANKPRTPPA